jgi:hypothetical protein
MMKLFSLWLFALVFACSQPIAIAFDAKPGKYKGSLKVTTSFPSTDVRQSVIQKATARLAANGRMIIALPNAIDGIEETGQRAAYLAFQSPDNNTCLVRILKDNFAAVAEATATRIAVVRTVNVNSPDAEGFATSHTVTMELRLTRVAP